MQTETRVKKRTPRKGLIVSLILIIVLLLGLVGAGGYAYYILSLDTIYSGVSVNGIELGGYTKEQAAEKIIAADRPRLEEIKMELTHEDRKWVIDYNDMNVTFNTQEVVDKAYAVGRQGSFIDRLMEIRKVANEGIEFNTTYTYDISPVKAKADSIAQEISLEPIDATVTFDPDAKVKFTFTESATGKGITSEDIMSLVQGKMEQRDFSTSEIPVEVLQPKVTVEDLKKATHKVATFTTTAEGTSNRLKNIELAASSFHGRVVQPGEIFSINEATGPRTKAKGYRDAPAIKNGNQLVDEPGGGVCQVSSTLYNAVLMADLEIVERWHHSWPSTYVPIGRDATINYGGADFRFKNNRETPIYLAAYLNGRKLTVEIYGEPLPDNMEIKVTSQQTATVQPPAPIIEKVSTMAPGTKEEVIAARVGRKSKTYKVYYKNGEKIKTVLVSEDYYKPVRGHYKVGPDLPPETEKPTGGQNGGSNQDNSGDTGE